MILHTNMPGVISEKAGEKSVRKPIKVWFQGTPNKEMIPVAPVECVSVNHSLSRSKEGWKWSVESQSSMGDLRWKRSVECLFSLWLK